MTNNEVLIAVITITLSSLSLIVTIVGWSITARRQKELLERQISAERNKAILGFSIPRQLQMIDTVRDWKLEGDRIGINVTINKLNDAQKEERFQEILSWRGKFYFYGINEKVLLLDQISEGNLYFLVDCYLNVFIKVLQKNNSDQTISELLLEAEKLDVDITTALGNLEMTLLQNN